MSTWKKSGRHPNYLPQYHGPVLLTLNHVRTIKSSTYNGHGYTATTIYRIRAGIERVEGYCLRKLVTDMSGSELKFIEEEIIAAPGRPT